MSGSWYTRTYHALVQGEKSIGHILLLVIRLYWGALLILTGFGKLTNAAGVGVFFSEIGIPFPMLMVYVVGLFELLGGLSLLLGLWARVMTIPLIVIFIVAYITAHTQALISFFVNPNLFFSESPFLYLYASLIVFCFGSGAISIDHWLEKKMFGRNL